ANFKLKTYTLTLITNPTDAGTVSGAGTYSHGETVQISATPNQGWFFANWTEVIGSDSTVDPEVLITHTFLIKNNRYFIANFSHEIYSINVTSNPIEGGSISGSGSFFFGQTAILKALPNAGWEFDKWTKNGSDVSTNSEYSFEVSGNANYVCHFKRADFIINCSSEPLNAGFTSGCGFARYLDEITVKAEANSNWGFRYWKENGDSVSADAEYTFTVSENRSIVAFFSLINGVENLNGNNIIPDNYFLSNAYPNPFNPETSFQFGLPEESYVTLMIYNIAGQVVETVLNNSLVQAGNYVNHFYASDYPSGIYIYLINANSTISEKNFKKSGKLLLLK
ncbi:MAG: T9SS type A sorting domain-containing protein, partial [Melioribacteraceae bacterium]